jgi:hypothetical protein
MIKNKRRLSLKSETVRVLAGDLLAAARGGDDWPDPPSATGGCYPSGITACITAMPGYCTVISQICQQIY